MRIELAASFGFSYYPAAEGRAETAMIDYEFGRCSRKCAASGRELQPQETVYSVLIAHGGRVVRWDYGSEAWQGPPEQAIAWWKVCLPDSESKKQNWAPSDVMLRYFLDTENDPAREDVRYVMALLLARRRIVRHETTETDEQGQQWMLLFCPRNECEYRVKVVLPDDERTQAIQKELEQLLGGDPTAGR